MAKFPFSLFAGLCCLGLCLFIAFFAEHLVWHDPQKINLLHRLSPPDWHYPLGTDHLGRCQFSRLLMGTALSLSSIFTTALMILGLGLPIGLIAAIGPNWLDHLLMRSCDILLAFPMLILALVLIGFLGASLSSAIIAVAIANAPGFARYCRTLCLEASQKTFLQAEGLQAYPLAHRILFGILPQILPTICLYLSLEMASLLLTLSSLSFLGLGAQAPQAEWGAMLNEARPFFSQAPHLVILPGLAILVTVLAFNLIGESLRPMITKRPSYPW